jgi:hypothetical protein
LSELIDDEAPAHKKIDKISYQLFELLAQITYTGRCLGGILTPEKAVKTCQKANAKEIFSLIQAQLNNEQDACDLARARRC